MHPPEPETGYPYWANCGLGSTVTLEDIKEIAPGMRITSTTSMTLCALDADKATLDMVVRNRIEGGPVPYPPTETLQEIEIPAALPSDEADALLLPLRPPAQDPTVKEGDETLVIDGKPIACHWIQRSAEEQGLSKTFKAWTSEQIPGGFVRFEARCEGDASRDVTSAVVSFLKK
jgi:hypothetical protein